MTLEREILPYLLWLAPSVDRYGAIWLFVIIASALTVLSLFIAYLVMLIKEGPGEGFYAVAKAIASALSKDLPYTSPRRIWAVARLAVQESLRHWVLLVFFLFAVVLLFASWFVDVRSDHPVRLYLSTVLNGTELLVLLLAVLLAAFSLPNDIKNRTLHTVVTKPVRPFEIVLGRIVGFAAVNSVILALMCIVSYGFVVRGLKHRHEILAEDMEQLSGEGPEAGGWKGSTLSKAYHQHEVTVAADGLGRTDTKMDHEHVVIVQGEGDQRTFLVGPPRGALTARVPIYGHLRFLDRAGNEGAGISVGKEWTYRKYIEGGSLAAAVWRFDGIRPQRVGESLPLEMNISVFRTYKGDIISGIMGAITLKNPTTGLKSEPLPFTAREFVSYTHDIPRQLKAVGRDGTLRDIDLFQDLVDEAGQLDVAITCEEPSQYFGMAQADVYVRGRDTYFAWNFVKGYLGIWLQMVMMTCFAVTLSTCLSGPVAMFGTLVVYVLGFFREFIVKIATGEQYGGGPVESLIRTVTQRNMMTELDMGVVIDTVVPAVDKALMFFIWLAAMICPDFRSFNTSRFVAYGFNIPGDLLAQNATVTAAFWVVLSIYGYFLLKSREVAA